MVKIGITGTPGTGKSTLARLLSATLSLPLVDIGEIAKRFAIDVYKDSKVIDTDRLEDELKSIIKSYKEGCVLESHLLCDMAIPLDLLIVLRCHPSVLEDRLKSKGWDEEKIKENVEAEILDYCLIRAEHNYKNVFQIDTTDKTPGDVLKKALALIEGRSFQDHVDWSDYLFRTL